ncbi:hypothetical protein [Methanolapillus ohkumae]
MKGTWSIDPSGPCSYVFDVDNSEEDLKAKMVGNVLVFEPFDYSGNKEWNVKEFVLSHPII